MYINKIDKIIRDFQKIKSKDKEVRLSVKEKYQDRIRKIESHFIWSVVMHESAKHSRKEKNVILSLIGEYYSIYHCCFSIAALDLNIKNQELIKMSHSKMRKLLERFENGNILEHDIIDLYNDSKYMREYVNYLSGSSGLDKFKSLIDFHTIKSKCFGVVPINKFSSKLEKENERLINEFIALTKRIEDECHRSIFPFLHMESDFDYYGEDFLTGFFIEDSIVKENVIEFLMKLDSE